MSPVEGGESWEPSINNSFNAISLEVLVLALCIVKTNKIQLIKMHIFSFCSKRQGQAGIGKKKKKKKHLGLAEDLC